MPSLILVISNQFVDYGPNQPLLSSNPPKPYELGRSTSDTVGPANTSLTRRFQTSNHDQYLFDVPYTTQTKATVTLQYPHGTIELIVVAQLVFSFCYFILLFLLKFVVGTRKMTHLKTI
jgi:hypothetical protein